jgi:hypothetical protein
VGPVTILILIGAPLAVAGIVGAVACWHRNYTPVWAVFAMIVGTLLCLTSTVIQGTWLLPLVAVVVSQLLIALYRWRGHRTADRRSVGSEDQCSPC